MPRATVRIVVCLAAPCVACACASSSSSGAGAGAFARSAAAGAETFDVAYRGMGGAIGAPLKDFNFAHARIPAVLHRAVASPYDTAGLESCEAVTSEIAALDLALGPDLDTPDVERTRDVYARGASLVADAALDAVRSAATGYVPMRSVIRRLSGAEKLERRLRRAELAGSVRRGFLKAIGMQRGCGWPAAPLGSPVRIPLSPLILARLASPGPEIVLAPLAPGAGLAAPLIRVSSPAAGAPAPTATVTLAAGGGGAGLGGGGPALPLAAHTWLQPGDGR